MEWLRMFFKYEETKVKEITPRSFSIGEVYKMKVASRSHVNKPYYVIVDMVTSNFIIISVPGCHSLKIEYNSHTWDYQIPRMELVGKGEEFVSLVYNQKIIEVR